MSLSGEILLGISKSCSPAFRQNAGCTRTPRLADVARGCSLVRQGSSVLQLGSLVFFDAFAFRIQGGPAGPDLHSKYFRGSYVVIVHICLSSLLIPYGQPCGTCFLLSMGFDISVKKVLVNHYLL